MSCPAPLLVHLPVHSQRPVWSPEQPERKMLGTQVISGQQEAGQGRLPEAEAGASVKRGQEEPRREKSKV